MSFQLNREESKTNGRIMKQEISGTLFSAMLFALDAFMGKDGVISILKFAKLDSDDLINLYNANYPANKPVSIEHFSKFVEALNGIMGHGTDGEIIYHYGKQYLGIKLIPYFSSGFESLIGSMEDWLGGTWKFEEDSSDTFKIHVKDSPFIFSKELGCCTCHVIGGVFACAMEQITGDQFESTEVQCMSQGDESCQFVLKKV